MEAQDFVDFGKNVLEYIAQYRENIRNRNVRNHVKPGYLHDRLPEEAPKNPEDWRKVLQDLDEHYLHGMANWQSPMFNAFFPSVSSYPSVIGDLITAGLGALCFSWDTNPAGTELEVIVMNWMGKMIGLPDMFLNSSAGPGGGALETSASECNLLTLLAAKEMTIRKFKATMDEGLISSKLVVYSSDQSNACVERCCHLAFVKIRLLPSDGKGRLRTGDLEQAIQEDTHNGFIPFYVLATWGTTQTCAFDDLTQIGPICEKYSIWLHVDAAYAGAAFVCPEYRHLMKGIEYADSFCFNPHKLLLMTFDTSALWLKDATKLTDSFQVDRIYLKGASNRKDDKKAPDYRKWQISLGKRSRSLKVWVTLRIYGISGIQKHIRNHFRMAKRFEDHVSDDSRFSVVSSTMGVIIFTLRERKELNPVLVEEVNRGVRMYMGMAYFGGMELLRYSVAGVTPEERDIDEAWDIIKSAADYLLTSNKDKPKRVSKRS